LLFDYIEGENVGANLTPQQLWEAAGIIACLHNYRDDIPVLPDEIHEDFSLPFCDSLEQFIADNFSTSTGELRAILEPCLTQLLAKNNEVKSLADKLKQKNIRMVLCHTDAHGFNLMQGKSLVLVDWEGVKLAPSEMDLMMFSKPDYWENFFKQYKKLRPDFELDNDVFAFYIWRRKIEDIWDFIASVLYDDLTVRERESNLVTLAKCCETLDDLWFEL
jgi:hypothetical protein